MHATNTTLSGLGFPEALRWRHGELWFSDMFRGRVVRWKPGTEPVIVIDIERGGPRVPGGLGWLPSGDLLVVDCERRRVLRVDDAGVHMHADLTDLLHPAANDMHVDPDGTAWVGGYGFDPETEKPTPSRLARVLPNGIANEWGPGLVFPNGCERDTDGALVVAETFADRVMRISPAGEGYPLAALPPGSGPDGLSVAASGVIFVALAFAGSVVTIDPSDGEVRGFHSAEPIVDGPGAGPLGCYDCAADPEMSVVAVAMASADEHLAMRVDTGSIVLIPTTHAVTWGRRSSPNSWASARVRSS